jgi:hypothetical protein
MGVMNDHARFRVVGNFLRDVHAVADALFDDVFRDQSDAASAGDRIPDMVG